MRAGKAGYVSRALAMLFSSVLYAGMYLLFLAPVITASFKMIVDMAIFLISFLSYKVV